MLVVDFILHIDAHLIELSAQYGVWIYAILFLIVFCETGLVVTPFLPGDSLLFAVGALAASGALDPLFAGLLIALAAFCGDNANYWLGRWLGPKVFRDDRSRIFKRRYLDRTQAFYDKYGSKMVVLARFVPIIRTFAPFVAGVGRMPYLIFLAFSSLGSALWVPLCIGAGYVFGNLALVKNNFSLVILAIVAISVLPMLFTFIKEKRRLQHG